MRVFWMEIKYLKSAARYQVHVFSMLIACCQHVSGKFLYERDILKQKHCRTSHIPFKWKASRVCSRNLSLLTVLHELFINAPEKWWGTTTSPWILLHSTYIHTYIHIKRNTNYFSNQLGLLFLIQLADKSSRTIPHLCYDLTL